MRGRYFYLGACTQGKIDTFHLVRTESPTHTEVRVFIVFVKGHSLNTSPEPSGMPMLKGTERGEVFVKHLPNT